MKDFATAVVIAVSAFILLTASTGDGFCFGNEPPVLSDNSTCSNKSDFGVVMCRLRCVLCHFGKVSEPFGCLSEDENATCICIGNKSGGGDGDNGTVPTSPSPIITTGLPKDNGSEGGNGDGQKEPVPGDRDDNKPLSG